MTERLPFHFSLSALEKEIATHSSVLAWRIPGMREPGRLPSNGVAQSQTRLKRLSSSGSKCVSLKSFKKFQVKMSKKLVETPVKEYEVALTKERESHQT